MGVFSASVLLLPLLLLSPVLAGGSEQQPDPRSKPERPNILLMVADDLGWTDLACYGHEFHSTPNLDRLAGEGMRFTAAYANAPNCAPTRAALMSGQYAPRTGIYTVNSAARGKSKRRKLIPITNRTDLRDEVLTLAEVLSDAGYATASIGKWHLGEDPTTQGFDVNIAGTASGHPKSYHSPYKNRNLEDGPKGEYLTDRLASEAQAYLEQRALEPEKPFFLYLPFFSVHTPIQGRKDLVAREKAALAERGLEYHPGYAALVAAQDEAVGKVLGTLEDLELAENTLVIFFSDNGGHQRFTSMTPLRGSKGMLYEGGIREPLIVRWPGRVTAGSECDVPVIGLDLFPTLVAASGAGLPEDKLLDGVDLAPLFMGGKALEREALFWHFPVYLEGYQKELWRTTPAGAVRSGAWKLIEFFEDGRRELYHLGNDEGEERDLAGERPEKVSELAGILEAWRRSVGAPVPTEINPEYEGE